jgi:hypothetical protein
MVSHHVGARLPCPYQERGNMFNRTLQILLGLALVAQLTGCFYQDDRWHHDHDRGYDHPEHHDDPGVNVHIHG